MIRGVPAALADALRGLVEFVYTNARRRPRKGQRLRPKARLVRAYVGHVRVPVDDAHDGQGARLAHIHELLGQPCLALLVKLIARGVFVSRDAARRLMATPERELDRRAHGPRLRPVRGHRDLARRLRPAAVRERRLHDEVLLTRQRGNDVEQRHLGISRERRPEVAPQGERVAKLILNTGELLLVNLREAHLPGTLRCLLARNERGADAPHKHQHKGEQCARKHHAHRGHDRARTVGRK